MLFKFLMMIDSGNCVFLILLDLTAAFDTVDHTILLSCLEHCVGIKSTALTGFISNLSERSSSLSIGQFSYTVTPLTYRVPQDSFLGPLLYCSLFIFSDIPFYCFSGAGAFAIEDPYQKLSLGRAKLYEWYKNMDVSNFFKFNENKAEVVLFGYNDQAHAFASSLGPLAPYTGSHARNLCVVFDGTFKLDKKVSLGV